MENGEWRMENGEWRMENGEWDREMRNGDDDLGEWYMRPEKRDVGWRW
jgi:hypothetical protein